MALSNLAEVTPDTTSEDIAAYADQVAKEVAAERNGEEEKSDAQIMNEHAGTPQPGSKSKETPAEENSGSDTALDGEESGDDAQEIPEWMTDDVRAEAAAYGIDESELADFASREEFDRALRLFDKSALDAGRKALAEDEDNKGQTRNEKGQFVKKEEPKSETSKESPKDGRYEVLLDPDIYDEGIISELTRMRDHYESRLEALESQYSESRASVEEQRFDNFVDSLGHPDLFGKTGEESEKELQRRRDLNQAVKAQLLGFERLGRPIEMTKQLVGRVAQMTFAEEFGKKLLKQQTRKIFKQSNGRMGGSPVKPIPPRDDPRDEADRLYKEMSSRNN